MVVTRPTAGIVTVAEKVGGATDGAKSPITGAFKEEK
jgi:hypothetical protein